MEIRFLSLLTVRKSDSRPNARYLVAVSEDGGEVWNLVQSKTQGEDGSRPTVPVIVEHSSSFQRRQVIAKLGGSRSWSISGHKLTQKGEAPKAALKLVERRLGDQYRLATPEETAEYTSRGAADASLRDQLRRLDREDAMSRFGLVAEADLASLIAQGVAAALAGQAPKVEEAVVEEPAPELKQEVVSKAAYDELLARLGKLEGKAQEG